MDEKTAEMIRHLKSNPAMLQTLMQSKDGQMLMRLLTQRDQGAGLQQAVQSAANGNPAEMMELMNQVMKAPGGTEIIARINKAIQK